MANNSELSEMLLRLGKRTNQYTDIQRKLRTVVSDVANAKNQLLAKIDLGLSHIDALTNCPVNWQAKVQTVQRQLDQFQTDIPDEMNSLSAIASDLNVDLRAVKLASMPKTMPSGFEEYDYADINQQISNLEIGIGVLNERLSDYQAIADDISEYIDVLTGDIRESSGHEYDYDKRNAEAKKAAVKTLDDLFSASYLLNGEKSPKQQVTVDEEQQHIDVEEESTESTPTDTDSEREPTSTDKMLSTYVFATMSAGKSTLINAFLHQELLVTSNLAATAKPYWIFDNDDRSAFAGAGYGANGQLVESDSAVSSNLLNKWNQSEDIHSVSLSGNIPFVDDDVRNLVLVDTPGPNNSRNRKHFRETQHLIEKETLPLVIYVINATQVGTDDDKSLLNSVVDSVKQTGNASRQILFVLNKMDAIPTGEVQQVISNVKNYLITNGVAQPLIFPVAARSALLTRTILAEHDKLDGYARKTPEKSAAEEAFYLLNGKEETQFNRLAPVSKSINQQINQRLATAVSANNEVKMAEIYSGVPSLELAIAELVHHNQQRKESNMPVL